MSFQGNWEAVEAAAWGNGGLEQIRGLLALPIS